MHQLTIAALLDLEHTIAAELFANKQYPWEVLPEIGAYILRLAERLDPAQFVQVKENVWVARSASVCESAMITGPCIIDEGAEIRHCAFIRGNAIIGRGAVVGNSTEVKNAVVFDGVQIPHYNYIGDSVLGYKSHMGAGSITSNVKSDKTPVVVKKGSAHLATGLKKFGAILGDGVEVGCGAVLNPGTVIGRHSNVYPLSPVRGFVPPDSIYKSEQNIAAKRPG